MAVGGEGGNGGEKAKKEWRAGERQMGNEAGRVEEMKIDIEGRGNIVDEIIVNGAHCRDLDCGNVAGRVEVDTNAVGGRDEVEENESDVDSEITVSDNWISYLRDMHGLLTVVTDNKPRALIDSDVGVFDQFGPHVRAEGSLCKSTTGRWIVRIQIEVLDQAMCKEQKRKPKRKMRV